MKRYILYILLFLMILSPLSAQRLRREGDFQFYLMDTVTNLSSERATNIWYQDDLRFSAGSPSLNSVNAENFNKDQGTAEAWIKPSWDGDDGLEHVILFVHASSNDRLRLHKWTDNTVLVRFSGGGVTKTAAGDASSWLAGDSHHIVVTWDINNVTNGTDNLTLYIDGVRVAGNIPLPVMAALGTSYLGQNDIGTGQFNGSLKYHIRNRPITAAEVTALWNSGDGHMDSFVAGPDTVAIDNFTDSDTGVHWHPSGQGVTATDSGGNVTLDVTDAEKLYVVGEDASLEDATGFSASGPVLIESASGADVTIGSGIAHASLNGSSQFFSVSDAAFPATGLTGAQDITASVWVNLRSLSAGTTGIVTKWQATGDKRMFSLAQTLSGRLRFSVSSDGTSANKSDSTTSSVHLEVEKWMYITAVYDASAGTVDFFVNGFFVEQIGGAEVTVADKAPNFQIGANHGGANHVDGKIGPTHLFNAIKTPAEIYAASRNFYFDHSGDGTLVCGYLFTEAGAATEIDNVEGTAGGDIIPQDSGAVIYSGLRSTSASYVQDVERVGISLDFDGSSDYVTTADLGVGAAGTIDLWLKPDGDIGNTVQGLFDAKPAVAGSMRLRGGNSDDLRYETGGSTARSVAIGDWTDEWHHIALTWSGSEFTSIFIDGFLAAGPSSNTFAPASNTFEIGRINSANNFDGLMSAIRGFSVELSDADVLWLATHPGADEAAIVANTSVTLGQMVLHHDYRNRNLIDVSSDGAGNLNGNDGTHSGTPSFVTTAHLTRNKWVDGNQEGGGIAPTIVGSNSVVTKDTSVVKFDGQSEKHVWSAADNNDEDTVATMALVSGNDYATRLWIRPDAMHDNSTIRWRIDGAGNIVDREIGKSLDDRGNFARSFDLDATYSAMAANNTVHDITTEDIGIAGWVKVSSDLSTPARILFKGGFGSIRYDLRVSGEASGELIMAIRDAGGDQYTIAGTADLRDDEWHHIAVIVDRNNAANCKIFVDTADDTLSRSGVIGDIGTLTNTDTFTLGAGTPAAGSIFDGEIRDVVLSYPADIMAAGEMGAAGEIAALFNNPGNPSAWPNSEDYWLCNDNAANTTVTGAVNNLTASANTDTFATLLWKYYEMSFTADQQAITAKLRITGAGAGANSATVYIDQCEVLEQLVVNPGMEGTYTSGVAPGWAKFGLPTLSEENTNVHSGGAAQQITDTGTSSKRIEQTITTVVGEYYTFSAWIRRESGSGSMRMRLFTPSMGTLDFDSTSATYEKVQFTFKALDTTLVIAPHCTDVSCVGLFDDVTLTRVDQRAASTAAKTPGFRPRRNPLSIRPIP